MSTRCKSGDLAIIAYDVPGCESNIGRVVHVRGPLAIDDRDHWTWLITPVTPEPYIVDIPETGGFRVMEADDTQIEHPDVWMVPIKPSELEILEQQQEWAEA